VTNLASGDQRGARHTYVWVLPSIAG
jgi:hypothetical protein